MAVKLGSQWRSSHVFIVSTIVIGFFNHLFLYGFIAPILPYMLEVRIGLDEANTQTTISYLLGVHALTSLICNPIVGHFMDKTSRRKGPMLLGLCGELASTVLIAVTKIVPLLFLGRVSQAISGTITYVAGFATLMDTVGAKQMGITVGIVSLFISLGTSTGPMVAGVLLERVGYPLTWASTIAVMLIDIVMRLVMVENPKYRTEAGKPPSTVEALDSNQTQTPFSAGTNHIDDRSPLLRRRPSLINNEQKGLRFYTYIFSQSRFTAAMGLYVVIGIIVVSLDATLPLHVQDKFQQGSSLAGLMFLAFQGPGILLNPFFGWVRDRVGTRYPTGIAFLLMAPDLCLMGIPGDSHFPWAQGERWKAVYVASIVILGVLISVLNGFAYVEGGLVVKQNETRHPGIFGPHGGSSRVYSIVGMTWTLGTLVGPLLSGYLRESIGYAKMNLVLATLSLFSGFIAFALLGSRNATQQELKSQNIEGTN